MKHTVSFEVKMPIPGIPYSNMATSITVEGDEPHADIQQHAFQCLDSQLQQLAAEMKGVLDNV